VSAGSLLVAAAAVLWGLWPLWVRGAGGPASAAAAFLVAGLVGLPLALRETLRATRRSRGAFALLLGLGALEAANVWLYFRALAEGAIAPAVLSHYLAPVLVALAAPRLLGEPRARGTPLALLLALAGTAALVLPGAPAGSGDATRTALVLGGLSAVFYAALVLLAKRLGRLFGDAELLVYHLLVAAPLLLAAGGARAPLAALVRPALGGLASALLAGLLYYAGLRRVPAERAAILTYLEPPAAILCGWLALGERPAPEAALGGALILAAGLIVVARPPRGTRPGPDRA
jgi:drug/metabolite transporter (DMT)-like permease